MAISAPTQSVQYANYAAKPPVLNGGVDCGPVFTTFGKLTFTLAGFTDEAAGDLKLLRMPAGKVRIYGALSRVICPVGTETADLDLGYGPYVKKDGTLADGDGAALVDSADVGGAAIDAALGVAYIEIESATGFDIVASFDTADSPAEGDLLVVIAYSHDGQGA